MHKKVGGRMDLLGLGASVVFVTSVLIAIRDYMEEKEKWRH